MGWRGFAWADEETNGSRAAGLVGSCLAKAINDMRRLTWRRGERDTTDGTDGRGIGDVEVIEDDNCNDGVLYNGT